MALGCLYLIDKSAWARASHEQVRLVLEPMIDAGSLATCSITNLEVLSSARNAAEYLAIADELAGFPEAPIGSDQLNRALDVQMQLAPNGHHRLPIPDLIIAAAAESAELSVLHYDADYERITEVTGQPNQWIVPRGSVP